MLRLLSGHVLPSILHNGPQPQSWEMFHHMTGKLYREHLHVIPAPCAQRGPLQSWLYGCIPGTGKLPIGALISCDTGEQFGIILYHTLDIPKGYFLFAYLA